MAQRLPRSFYRRDPVTVARALLGQRLVHRGGGRRLAGVIVETEAYLGVPDRAAHSFGGRRTRRVRSMWLDGGHAYVYFIYGFHWCLNVVAGRAEEPVAVLLRALEPVEGLPRMRVNREQPHDDTELCSGPAKLCDALAITGALDGADLVASGALWIERARARPHGAAQIAARPRVGVAYAGAWARRRLRFYLKANPHVSRP